MDFLKKHWAILSIINVYVVGVIGFLIPSINQQWASLTAFSLLVSLFILITKHETKNSQFYFSMLLVGFLGFIIEVIGVKTGWLFGSYTYGNKLGPKILDTPIMIGVNWVLLIYLSNHTMRHFFSKTYQVALAGSILMVAIDFLIEPFAIYFGLWTWEAVHVPIQNYIMWGIAAFALHLIFSGYNLKIKNSIAHYILAIMVAFFMIIDFLVIWF